MVSCGYYAARLALKHNDVTIRKKDPWQFRTKGALLLLLLFVLLSAFCVCDLFLVNQRVLTVCVGGGGGEGGAPKFLHTASWTKPQLHYNQSTGKWE